MRLRVALVVLVVLAAMGGAGTAVAAVRASSVADVVPAPMSAEPLGSSPYALTAATKIHADGAEAAKVGEYLARIWRRSTGYPLPVVDGPGNIVLLLTGADPALGNEGYQLDSSGAGVVIRANKPAGLFAGVQTLRQLVPAAAEGSTVRPGPWPVATGKIVDRPRPVSYTHLTLPTIYSV